MTNCRLHRESKQQKQYLWMAVTADEYELPLVVERTAAELARCLGITVSTIRTKECRDRKQICKASSKTGGRTSKFGGRYRIRVVEEEKNE